MADEAEKKLKPIQVFLAADVMDAIDRLARRETISKSAWARRLIISTAKEADRKEPVAA